MFKHCNRGYPYWISWQFSHIFAFDYFDITILNYLPIQETPEDGGWHDLVAQGFIEYIDTEEEETTMISMTINVSI